MQEQLVSTRSRVSATDCVFRTRSDVWADSPASRVSKSTGAGLVRSGNRCSAPPYGPAAEAGPDVEEPREDSAATTTARVAEALASTSNRPERNPPKPGTTVAAPARLEIVALLRRLADNGSEASMND